jgi:hypothetical protein
MVFEKINIPRLFKVYIIMAATDLQDLNYNIYNAKLNNLSKLSKDQGPKKLVSVNL